MWEQKEAEEPRMPKSKFGPKGKAAKRARTDMQLITAIATCLCFFFAAVGALPEQTGGRPASDKNRWAVELVSAKCLYTTRIESRYLR